MQVRVAVVGLIPGAIVVVAGCGLVFPTVLGEMTAGDAGPDVSAGDDASGAGGGDAASDGPTGVDASADASGDTSAAESGLDGGACTGPTSSDPKNCGTCGHDCLGGACEGGLCQPVAIVSGESSPEFVAVDANNVYWTNFGISTLSPQWRDGAVRRAAKDGTSPGDLVPSAPSAYRVLSDGHAVFYDERYYGLVDRVDPSGGLPTHLWGNTRPFPTGLAVSPDAGALYWVGSEDDGGTAIRGAPLPAGPAATLSFDTDGKYGAFSLAVDSTDVYFTAGVQQSAGGAQRVKRVSLAGCAGGGACGVTRYTGFNLAAIAVDDNYIFVADSNVGTITRVPKDADGGAPVTITTGLHAPSFLLVDGGWLYWTETVGPGAGTTGGAVGRTKWDGTMASRLAVHQAFPLGVAVDATAIYWANQGTMTTPGYFDVHDGQIMRLAR